MTKKPRQTDPASEPERDGPISDTNAELIKEELIWGSGYGRPPLETRFQKGQSGNPNGRPRKTPAKASHVEPPPISEMMLEEARRPIAVKEGGRSFEIPAKQAVMRAQLATAIKGSPIAQKNFLEQTERLEREEQEEITKTNDLWRSYMAIERAKIAEAGERAESAPNPLPHPDDIIIEPGLRVRFNGPMSAEELACLEERRFERDTFFLQHELEERTRRPRSRDVDDGPARETSGALLVAEMLNLALPPRWRLSDGDAIDKLMHNQRWTTRELLKIIRRRWRTLGLKVRRGQFVPSREWVVQQSEAIIDLLVASRKGQVDLEATARGDGGDF